MTAAILEYLGMAIVLVAVWRIGVLDIRGQYLMLAAQVVWTAYAVITKQWGLTAQSAALLVLTLRGIRKWSVGLNLAKTGGRP